MQAKLTLKLDENTVIQAKKYASQTHQSLSSIVEGYFRTLASRIRGKQDSPTPIVDSLAGSIKGSRNRDIRTEYTNYLEKKYSR
jgi:hypothetical protein